MTRRAFLLLAACSLAWSADPEPLVGKWRLKSQQVSGKEMESRPLTLEIRPAAGALEFVYSVPESNSMVVSLRFAVRLDGTAGDVKDAQGRKIGTAKVGRMGAGEYSMTLEGPHRPTASGKMKLSADGKSLVCESDAAAAGGGHIHTVQTFVRQ